MCTFRCVFFRPSLAAGRRGPNKGRGGGGGGKRSCSNPDTLLKNVNEVGQTSLDRTLDSRLSRLLKILFHLVLVISSRVSASFQMLASSFFAWVHIPLALRSA